MLKSVGVAGACAAYALSAVRGGAPLTEGSFASGATVYARNDSPSTRRTNEGSQAVDRPSWSRLIDDLLVIRGYEDDWDGQAAVAPGAALVDAAIALAQSLRAVGNQPAARVVAGVNGTIVFEWYGPTEYAEIEVLTPDQAEGRTIRHGSNDVTVFDLARRS